MKDRHPADKAADEVLDERAHYVGDINPNFVQGVEEMRDRWKKFGDREEMDE